MKEMKTKEFREYHPFRQAAEVHYRLMSIFPFDDETGKVVRLIMNYFIIQAGYFPVIIPDVARQHYYDALRVSSKVLHDLIVQCTEQMLDLSLKNIFDGQEIW